jgi:hypothetical protein
LPSLDEHQLLGFLVALTVVILLARLLGEFARRLGQPEVVGQLVAGQPRSGAFRHLLAWSAAGTDGRRLGGRPGVLRAHLQPGLLAAGFAIVPSLPQGGLSRG